MLLVTFIWQRDLCRESNFKGSQNIFIIITLKLGIRLFIFSEIIFFIRFFWTYFHFIFIFSGELGFTWPPVSLGYIDYTSLPLLNTLILLIRGVTLTLSHMYIQASIKSFNKFLSFTIILGGIFSWLQIWEYKSLDFLMSDSSYGRIFFIGTGFHGLHVLLGSILLRTVLIRRKLSQINKNRIIFEVGAWYWHFVDVVWLFLFTEFYWWPNL